MAVCKICGHEERYHIIPEKHILKTRRCTKHGCDCKQFIGKEDKNGN